MKMNWSDKIRVRFQVFLEPLLFMASGHQAGKTALQTASKYIRAAVIEKLERDGYPLLVVGPNIKKDSDIHVCMTYKN
jgi:hypothetical protein